LAKISRRKRKPTQKGVQAIFSDGSKNRKGFASYDLEDEIEPSSSPVPSLRPNGSRRDRRVTPFRIGRIFLVAVLAGIMLTTVVGFSVIDLGSQSHLGAGTGSSSSGSGGGLGSSGTGTKPPIGSFKTIAPSFYALSNVAEAILSSGNSYSGVTRTSADDFIVIQIAYSMGGGGNLPDIAKVTDLQSSVYTMAASASLGVGANFWEQAWTGRASAATNSTTITVIPDWLGCKAPCVASIIIMMTISRYRGVSGVGSSIAIAPDASSTSQSVSITATGANSMLVELLSHGAYSSCAIDAAQPATGQTSRNCLTATTERAELFDHAVTNAQSYTESFTWAQVELQRGIYLELKGNSVPNP
jgi:hypothetical protein